MINTIDKQPPSPTPNQAQRLLQETTMMACVLDHLIAQLDTAVVIGDGIAVDVRRNYIESYYSAYLDKRQEYMVAIQRQHSANNGN